MELENLTIYYVSLAGINKTSNQIATAGIKFLSHSNLSQQEVFNNVGQILKTEHQYQDYYNNYNTVASNINSQNLASLENDFNKILGENNGDLLCLLKSKFTKEFWEDFDDICDKEIDRHAKFNNLLKQNEKQN